MRLMIGQLTQWLALIGPTESRGWTYRALTARHRQLPSKLERKRRGVSLNENYKIASVTFWHRGVVCSLVTQERQQTPNLFISGVLSSCETSEKIQRARMLVPAGR